MDRFVNNDQANRIKPGCLVPYLPYHFSTHYSLFSFTISLIP
jgi:hypothetical protein